MHNVLCGEGALKWALSQGFEECNGDQTNDKKKVLTDRSRKEWESWIKEKKNLEGKKSGITPDDNTLEVVKEVEAETNVEEDVEKQVENSLEVDSKVEEEIEKEVERVDDDSHDTVGLICLDGEGRLACGTSTSG